MDDEVSIRSIKQEYHQYRLFDHPLGWVDTPPIEKVIITGADYQIRTLIENLCNTFPHRYSWIAFSLLGSFHKLKNFHEKVVKRYRDIHIAKHIISYCDNPTKPNVESFLSMSDYEESNLYFIHDVICGIQELQLAIKKFMGTKFSSGVERQETTACFCYENKNDFSIFDSTTDEHLGETTTGIRFFCEELAKYEPTLKVIYEYLFEDGIVAINEAQRYGLFDLEYVFTKLIAPIEFTTRGINYGPALVAQMKHTMILRPHERDALKVLFVSNKSKEKEKCQPQDKNLETEFNNASKNAFKLATVQTILSRSATIQEKHESHKNLQIEIGRKRKAYKNKAKQILNPNRVIRLHACWRKAFKELSLCSFKDPQDANKHAICCPFDAAIKINQDISNAKSKGVEHLERVVEVKEMKKNGWRFQNPSFPEIHTVQKEPSRRQITAALNHARQQIQAMSQVLTQSGLQATLSAHSKPPQLLKPNGELNFGKKADLTTWLLKTYPIAFVNEDQLKELTGNYKLVDCMIRDCMFDFRGAKVKSGSMENVLGNLYQRTASPYLTQFGGKSENQFTLIQTFDRRADKTKGSTEANRQSALKAPLVYSGQRVSMKDHVKNYATMWLDRENGRQKIITSYARFMGHGKKLRELHPPRNVTHIVVGGNCGIATQYSTDHFGDITAGDSIQYICNHPEADTVIFYVLKQYLESRQMKDDERTLVIVSCPEADHFSILLLCYKAILELLDKHRCDLYCAIHNRLVDSAKEPAEAPIKRKTVKDMSTYQMSYYVDVRKLYSSINGDQSFALLSHSCQSLGAVSIATGNDKSPSLRFIGKKTTLENYRSGCSEGKVQDLVMAMVSLSKMNTVKRHSKD